MPTSNDSERVIGQAGAVSLGRGASEFSGSCDAEQSVETGMEQVRPDITHNLLRLSTTL